MVQKISANTASREELLKIEGLGPATTDRLLDLRSRQPITVEDFRNLPGYRVSSIAFLEFATSLATRGSTEEEYGSASGGHPNLDSSMEDADLFPHQDEGEERNLNRASHPPSQDNRLRDGERRMISVINERNSQEGRQSRQASHSPRASIHRNSTSGHRQGDHTHTRRPQTSRHLQSGLTLSQPGDHAHAPDSASAFPNPGTTYQQPQYDPLVTAQYPAFHPPQYNLAVAAQQYPFFQPPQYNPALTPQQYPGAQPQQYYGNAALNTGALPTVQQPPLFHGAPHRVHADHQELNFNTREERRIKTPKSLFFDGSASNFEFFWSKFQRFLTTHQIVEIDMVIWHLTDCLQRKASNYLENILSRRAFTCTGELKEAMQKRFGDNDLPAVRLMNFRQATQNNVEHVKDFVERLWQLVNKAYPDIRSQASLEGLVLDQLIQGIKDHELASYLTLQNFHTVEEALNGKKLFELNKSRRPRGQQQSAKEGINENIHQSDHQEESSLAAQGMVDNPMSTNVPIVRAVKHGQGNFKEQDSPSLNRHFTDQQYQLVLEKLQTAERERNNLALRLEQADRIRNDDMNFLANTMHDMMKLIQSSSQSSSQRQSRRDTTDYQNPSRGSQNESRQRPSSGSPFRAPRSPSPSPYRSDNRRSPGRPDAVDQPYCKNCKATGHYAKYCLVPKVVNFKDNNPKDPGLD